VILYAQDHEYLLNMLDNEQICKACAGIKAVLNYEFLVLSC
jgi:hypothetical protein